MSSSAPAVGGGQRGQQRGIAGVRLGAGVQPAVVARHVARQRDQQPARLVARVDQRVRRGQVMNVWNASWTASNASSAVSPSAARHARQLPPVPMDQLPDPAEKRAAVRLGAGATSARRARAGGFGRRRRLGFGRHFRR